MSNAAIRNIALGLAFALYVSLLFAEILRRQEKLHTERGKTLREGIHDFLATTVIR
jgi:hypothetical protein